MTLTQLINAYKFGLEDGRFPRPLVIDNDQVSVSMPVDDDDPDGPWMDLWISHPGELLEELLTLLGIRYDYA